MGRRFEGYILTSPPSLLYIPICNIFSHSNKSELFLLCSEIRLNRPNSVNNFRVCSFLFISFIILLYLFNIICRVALLGFCFSGKITRFSQHVVGAYYNLFSSIDYLRKHLDNVWKGGAVNDNG